MSNGVFIFNFLVLVLSEILGGSKIYTRGPAPPGCPQRRNFCTQSEYFTISNSVFNFNILAVVVSEILRGSQIYVRGPDAPCTPLAENFILGHKHFSLGGVQGGTGPPNVNLGPTKISETTRARN